MVDGDILPDTPARLRAAGKFLKIKVIAGVPLDAGAYIVGQLIQLLFATSWFEKQLIWGTNMMT